MLKDFIERERLRDLLFGFEGRITRRQYWLAWLCWLAVGVVFAVVIFFILGWLLGGYVVSALSVVVSLVVLNSAVAVGIKRLHDRDKSGRWLLLFYGVPAAIWANTMMSGPSMPLNLLELAIFIWMLIELGGLPGTPGPNTYGPEPELGTSGSAAAS